MVVYCIGVIVMSEVAARKLKISVFYYYNNNKIIIIIIIIISIFKEDNVFSITASLPYGPPVNTDIDYYRLFFRTCLFLQCCEVSC